MHKTRIVVLFKHTKYYKLAQNPLFFLVELKYIKDKHIVGYRLMIFNICIFLKERLITMTKTEMLRERMSRNLDRTLSDHPRQPQCDSPEVVLSEIQKINEFLDILDAPDTNIMHKAFFAIMIDIGARCGEVTNLRWSDIQDGVIHIRQASRPMGEWYKPHPTMTLDRALQIGTYTRAALSALKTYQDEQAKAHIDVVHDTDLIFTTLNGHPLVPIIPNYWLRKICCKHQMAPIDVHLLRRMYISIISALFHEARQSTTGHSQASTTLDIYVQAFIEQVVKSNGTNYSLIDLIRNNNRKPKKEENNNE